MNDYSKDYETIAREEKKSIPFELFKGMGGKHGTMAIELREAYTNDPSKNTKSTGVVFLNMTPTVGKNQYDWSKKVSMALGLPDISKILAYIKNPRHPMFSKSEYSCSIIHDRGMGSSKQSGLDVTYLNINMPEEGKGYFFNITKKDNGTVVSKVSVPVSPDEIIIITGLLQTAISAMLSWSAPSKPDKELKAEIEKLDNKVNKVIAFLKTKDTAVLD